MVKMKMAGIAAT